MKLDDDTQAELDELRAENERLKAEKTPDPAEKLSAELAQKTAILDRRERVLGLAIQKGLDPEKTFALLGLDGADDEVMLDRIATNEETVAKDTRNQVLRDNGRSPHTSVKLGGKLTADVLDRMGDDQLSQISPRVVAEALAEADSRGTRPTLRQKIANDLRGTE